MLFHPQLHNFIACFDPVSSTYLNDKQIWSPECSGATKMASVCRMLFCLPLFPFFLKTCIAVFFLFAANENLLLYTTSHSPPSVSSVFQLPLLFGLIAQQGDRGLNIDSRGESPCVPKQFCLHGLRSSHPPRPSVPSLSGSRFCF